MGAEELTYAVTHRTTLRYTGEVALSYNEVRMRPRDRGAQLTLAFSLRSTPSAVPRNRVDYFGNYVHRIDVSTPHRELEFLVDSVVENAEPSRRRLPEWDPDVLARDSRLEYALPSPRVPLQDPTRRLWEEWNGGDRSFDAVLATARRIPQEFRYVSGATTVESSIGDLLEGGAGVCQDFTHLFLAMLRGAGWPARYVSGYLGPAAAEREIEGQSHAWVEVCGSNGRWVGLDPTQGRHAGAEHLRLAVGRDYGDVAPHHGLFYGQGRGAPPEVKVRVERLSSAEVAVVDRTAAVHWQQQQQQQAGAAPVGAEPVGRASKPLASTAMGMASPRCDIVWR